MKVAIIGAGICGLYLAWKLSEKGHKVTVFEKKEKIGKDACSGLISERILKFIPASQKLTQNQIEFALIHWVAGGWRPKRTLKINFSKKFLVIDRFKLDNLVAGLALSAGAKIILNHFIDSLPQGFDRIIGCDGYNSSIRKSLGLPTPNFRLAIQGFIPKADFSNYVETWPQKKGFIWKIPRGKEIEYGIIDKPTEVQDYNPPATLQGKTYRLFKNFLKRNNLQLSRMKSGIVPQGLLIPSNSSITLGGDAVGLTKPWSGGGVIWGLMSAEILLKNFPNFLKYQKEMKNFFLPKIFFSKIATKIGYFLGFKIPWLIPKNIKIEGDFLF